MVACIIIVQPVADNAVKHCCYIITEVCTVLHQAY